MITNRFTSEPEQVSARMRLIRGKNTKPELALFLALTNAGIRFKRHVRIGKIEVDAMLRRRLVIFVDSPFWHLRDEKLLNRLSDHWQNRLLKNRARDRKYRKQLRKEGYSTLRFWADKINNDRTVSRIRQVLERLDNSVSRYRG